ncbi:MAG TPA: ATP-binding protein [Xanthobacteraceae bacterium]|nr:ATP-binding protein [Xanthobacteraceae bacterium]
MTNAVRHRLAYPVLLALSGLVAALAPTAARAQDLISGGPDLGWIGLGGMIACAIGIVFGILNRRSIALHEKAERLEGEVESRDDKIWALEERLAHLTALVDGQDDYVVREDEHGRVTHVSSAMAALSGKEARELIGRPLRLPVLRGGLRTQMEDGTRVFDQEIATQSGPRWIAWKEAAVRDGSGEVVEIQRTGRDITARIATERALGEAREQAEAANRAKSRFLAVVSHEVRTPLNGILGMTHLLLETPLSQEQQTYARAVKSSGEALLGLIEEILDFSKIEAGRIELEAAPFDLAELVTDVVELLSPRAQAKGIEIAALFSADLPQIVSGDAARLRQVLLNLAGNAVKFTDAGGVAVLVERHKDAIRFSVRDSGPGIEADAQTRIFEEFEQGDGTLTRKHGGTGLGLAIASRIVERMGGEIALSSVPDGGAEFRFTVALPTLEERGNTMPDFSGHDILVLSPSSVIAPLLAKQLEQWGARVATADSRSFAETLLPERHWSHCIIDRAFGHDEVLALFETAKRNAAHCHVLLTPAERRELPRLQAGGLASYLIKPVRALTLAQRLANPAVDSSASEMAQADVAAAPGKDSLSILVAEDNDINALLVQALLARMGHRVTVVSDGAVAVNAVASADTMGAPYDVVLMDLHLPGMDGLEATRRLRALGGSASRVPVIALTANAFPEDRANCLAAGMNGFVVKPVDRQGLEKAIAGARRAAPEKAVESAA